MDVTPIVRCSFMDIIVAKDSEDGKSAAWQGTAMFEKNNPEHISWLKKTSAEYDAFLAACYPDPAKRPRIKFTGDANSPCKDGDTAVNKMGIPIKEKYPEYEGHYILRFGAVAKSTNSKTGEIKVFSRKHTVYGNVWDPKAGAWNIINDQNQIYGGCWGRFGGNFYQRKRSDNPGVSVGLQGFQFVKDGEPFGSAPLSPDAFGALPGMNDPANYEADPLGASLPAQTDSPFGDMAF